MNDIKKRVKAKILKSILNKFSDVSLTYNQLNRELPLSVAIKENRLDELIELYEQIITDVINYLSTTEYGKGNNTTT